VIFSFYLTSQLIVGVTTAMFSAVIMLIGLCSAVRTTTTGVEALTITLEWPASITLSPSLLDSVAVATRQR